MKMKKKFLIFAASVVLSSVAWAQTSAGSGLADSTEEERRKAWEQEWEDEICEEHKTFIIQGLSLISLMREKAMNDDYSRLLGRNDEFIAKLHELCAGDMSKIHDVIRLSGVFDMFSLSEERLLQFSPMLKRELEILLLKNFTANWSNKAEMDKIDAASFIASERTFVSSELKEDCIYIFGFEDDSLYPVAVGFMRGEGNSVSAFSTFVLSKDFVTDVFKLAIFSDIGLKWDRVY